MEPINAIALVIGVLVLGAVATLEILGFTRFVSFLGKRLGRS